MLVIYGQGAFLGFWVSVCPLVEHGASKVGVGCDMLMGYWEGAIGDNPWVGLLETVGSL